MTKEPIANQPVNTSELIHLIDKVANKLRGPYRPPQYRRVMLPMTVLRRFDCVLAPTKQEVLEYCKKIKSTSSEPLLTEKLKKISGQSFANYSEYDFGKLIADQDSLATNIYNYIEGFTDNAKAIFDRFEFGQEIEKMEESNRLYEIFKAFSDIDLHPHKVAPNQMGDIFEGLIRKYNEMSNEEAGDHFTPRDVIQLMAELIFTGDEDIHNDDIIRSIYDPTCGTGGMLMEANKYLEKHNPKSYPELFGQDYNKEAWAICAAEMMIKGQGGENGVEPAEKIAFGDSLGNSRTFDAFKDKKFDYMMANPPFGVEWSGAQHTVKQEYDDLGFDGRFGAGLPRKSDGALLFLQHMISKMKDYEEGDKDKPGSKIAVVFNGSPLFTGEPGPSESNIRRWIIENDWLDAIIALPDQMFFNTGINTYIWLLSNRKPDERKGKIKLVDASQLYVKMRKNIGNKRKSLQEDDEDKTRIETITRLYADGKDGDRLKIDIDGVSKSKLVVREFDNAAFGFIKLTIERPLKLHFEVTEEKLAVFRQKKAFLDLPKDRQKALERVLSVLQGEGLSVRDRTVFINHLAAAAESKKLKLAGTEIRLIWKGLGVRDESAEICRDFQDNPEPDPDLRDSEIVPLPLDTPLPIRDAIMGYGRDAKPGRLLDYHGLKACLEDYFAKEVAPHWPDAWIDWPKTKLGYEIPFTRHFYEYEPPRPLEDIEADIKRLTDELVKSLGAG